MHAAKSFRTVLMAVTLSALFASVIPAQTPARSAAEYGPGADVKLVAPFATPSARNRSQVVGWPAGRKPVAPPGFQVDLYADRLNAPRWTYVLPNGDVLAALSLDGRILLLRDGNQDGRPETRADFLT